MKTLAQLWMRKVNSGLSAAIIASLLMLTALPATAQTGYSSTGWITSVPVPPIVCTNAAGQVLVRGNVHWAAVQSTDARLTGNRLIFVNGAYQADGSVLFWGTCYQQVGTFDSNTNFTPTAGLWEISYTGTMQPDYSMQLNFTGYGSGGAIDGQRLTETLTRAAATGPLDPAVPYLYTGTLKGAPLNTVAVADNFDDNSFTGGIYGSGRVFETNGQFNVFGSFPTRTHSILDSYVFAGYSTTWTLADGTTREWRADLLSLSDNGTNTAILGLATPFAAGYALHKGKDFVYLVKWSSSFRFSILWCQRASLPNTDVVLSLALTRRQPNVVITARVLSKAEPNTVLFAQSVTDTPGSDASLSGAQFQALTGIQLTDLVADAAEPPPSSVAVVLGVFQYTDGSQPVPAGVFDNLELRTTQVPPLGIERAVRLSWPVLGSQNYAIEFAPDVQGPWQPLPDQAVPGMNQTTVPASDPMKVFRLIQAP